MRQTIIMVLFLAVTLTAGSVRADQNDPRLDKLFGRLHVSENRQEIKQIEVLIWRIWHQNKSDTVNLFMAQGMQAMQAGAYRQSFHFFDQIVKIAPKFAEGWNKRATVLYLMGRLQDSIADCDKVLALEPRHFGALSGLGLIYTALKEPKKALAAYERMLKVHPQAETAKQNIKILKEAIVGNPT